MIPPAFCFAYITHVGWKIFHADEKRQHAKRIELAKNLLRETKETTRDIALQVGLPNYNYFLRLFKTITGQTSSAYRTAAQMSKE